MATKSSFDAPREWIKWQLKTCGCECTCCPLPDDGKFVVPVVSSFDAPRDGRPAIRQYTDAVRRADMPTLGKRFARWLYAYTQHEFYNALREELKKYG